MRVRPATSDHFQWIAQRAQLVPGPLFRAFEAVDRAGRIHGMVGLDGWTYNAVCVHFALENPAALRSLCRVVFPTIFQEVGLGVMTATILSTNARSIRVVRKLGFEHTHTVKEGWAKGVDVLVFEMRPGNCRWLAGENVKHQEAA